MGVSRKAGTWLAVLAGVTVVVVGWAFFAVALTTDVFSGDGIEDRAIVVSAPSSGDGNAVATIDVAALEAHLAAVDERIAALEDAQANAPAVVSAAATPRPSPLTSWLSRSALPQPTSTLPRRTSVSPRWTSASPRSKTPPNRWISRR